MAHGLREELSEGYAEGGRLARARASSGDQVGTGDEEAGYRKGLYRSGFLEALS
jgi:hypothetical protein